MTCQTVFLPPQDYVDDVIIYRILYSIDDIEKLQDSLDTLHIFIITLKKIWWNGSDICGR